MIFFILSKCFIFFKYMTLALLINLANLLRRLRDLVKHTKKIPTKNLFNIRFTITSFEEMIGYLRKSGNIFQSLLCPPSALFLQLFIPLNPFFLLPFHPLPDFYGNMNRKGAFSVHIPINSSLSVSQSVEFP